MVLLLNKTSHQDQIVSINIPTSRWIPNTHDPTSVCCQCSSMHQTWCCVCLRHRLIDSGRKDHSVGKSSPPYLSSVIDITIILWSDYSSLKLLELMAQFGLVCRQLVCPLLNANIWCIIESFWWMLPSPSVWRSTYHNWCHGLLIVTSCEHVSSEPPQGHSLSIQEGVRLRNGKYILT